MYVVINLPTSIAAVEIVKPKDVRKVRKWLSHGLEIDIWCHMVEKTYRAELKHMFQPFLWNLDSGAQLQAPPGFHYF
jgi:hypothetical protein